MRSKGIFYILFSILCGQKFIPELSKTRKLKKVKNTSIKSAIFLFFLSLIIVIEKKTQTPLSDNYCQAQKVKELVFLEVKSQLPNSFLAS